MRRVMMSIDNSLIIDNRNKSSINGETSTINKADIIRSNHSELDFAWFFGGYPSIEIASLKNDVIYLAPYLNSIGVSALCKVANLSPDVGRILAANGIMPEQQAPSNEDDVRALHHANKILVTIVTAINKIDNKSEFLDYVMSLASFHCGLGIKTDSTMAFIGCLRQAILDQLLVIRSEQQNSTTGSLINNSGSSSPKMRGRTSSCGCCNCKYNKNQSSSTLIDRYNRRDFDVWNKFFMTFSLAFINGMERNINARKRSNTKGSRKNKTK